MPSENLCRLFRSAHRNDAKPRTALGRILETGLECAKMTGETMTRAEFFDGLRHLKEVRKSICTELPKMGNSSGSNARKETKSGSPGHISALYEQYSIPNT